MQQRSREEWKESGILWGGWSLLWALSSLIEDIFSTWAQHLFPGSILRDYMSSSAQMDHPMSLKYSASNNRKNGSFISKSLSRAKLKSCLLKISDEKIFIRSWNIVFPLSSQGCSYFPSSYWGEGMRWCCTVCFEQKLWCKSWKIFVYILYML